MALPGPETALAATIHSRPRVRHHPPRNRASWSLAGPLYDFSITYTKTQRLTRDNCSMSAIHFFTAIDSLQHNIALKRAKNWRLILTLIIAFLVVGCDRVDRKTHQANVALNGNAPLGIAGRPWDGPDGVVLYRTGRGGAICYDAFRSKDLHDHLLAKNGQPVTVEYDTFSDFGKMSGYNVHSVGGMILASGYHVLREDFAATAGVARSGPGSAGNDDCW
jgi:hypothetical protein